MSNYAICTMQKFKSGNIGGYDSHVKRKHKKHSNQQIDNSKSHLNRSLIQSELNLRERMISILKKQESMLNQNKSQLKKTLENGQIDLKENTNKVLMEMQSIENELSSGIERLNNQNKKSLDVIEQRTSDLVASTRKSALITHWIDAFKYGFATAVILLPVLLGLIKFNII